jgi:hypothetical protein
MKTLDNTKRIVLGLGILTAVVSLVGAVSTMNLMNFFFPLYAGLTLIGLTVFNKPEEKIQVA